LVSSQGGVFYTFDERGNVAQSLSSTGTVNVSYMYDAYGQVTTTRYPLPFSYGGQWGYQTQGILILCTHRYYDPANGRWLTRDPIGYDGGINLYSYCNNDPVNECDPIGNHGIGMYSCRAYFVPVCGGFGYCRENCTLTNVIAGKPAQSFNDWSLDQAGAVDGNCSSPSFDVPAAN